MNTNSESDPGPSLASIGTLVAWLFCLAVAVIGLLLSYPGPHAPAEASVYLPTKVVNAQLTPQPPPLKIPTPVPGPPSDPDSRLPASPAPMPAPLTVEKPVLTAVAPPSPAIAFALPVEGLTRVVDVGEAGYTRSNVPLPPPTAHQHVGGADGTPTPPPTQVAATAPAITQLTLGEGKGRQPPPEYPREAVRARQEGTVRLRFTVGEDGRVASVEVVTPSPWPLLDQAATRAVRDTWQFSPGPGRVYEVPIKFQLTH